MATFQIRGADNVIQAFKNRDVKSWAIFQGKQFLFKGDDETDLQSVLEFIANGSKVVYTLKVYDSLTQKEVKEKTDSDGSFNFILLDEGEDYDQHAQYANSNRAGKLYERLRAIEDHIAGIGQIEPEEKPETFEDILKGFIKEPDALIKLINAGKMILGINPGPNINGYPAQPAPAYNGQGQRIGNINKSMTTPAGTPEERLNRLASAIDILEKNDPKIVEHLEKLASISEGNINQFNFLLQALENF